MLSFLVSADTADRVIIALIAGVRGTIGQDHGPGVVGMGRMFRGRPEVIRSGKR